MSPHQQTDAEPSVTTLVAGIVRDAQELVKEQFELFKHEIRSDVKKTEQAGLTLGAGLCFGLAGILLLSLMLVEVLHEAVPSLPRWSCYGIAGLILFLVGCCLAYVGKRRLDSVHPLSDESAQTLRENVQWITKRK